MLFRRVSDKALRGQARAIFNPENAVPSELEVEAEQPAPAL
jgi:hypothetical protein